MFSSRSVSFSLALFIFLATRVIAATPAASTFYIDRTETEFSINIANDASNGVSLHDTSDEVSFYFTSPAYSWVAVGFGERMKNSMMLVMYLSEDGEDVTISPRRATGHSEPTFDPSIKLSILPGTGVVDDMFVLRAICHNCKSSIDIKADTPMIYAFGPGNRLQSDSPSAALKRHHEFGRFTMDMLHATGMSGVPAPAKKNVAVQLKGGMKRDHDRANLAHAVLGCIALFVLWPLNMIVAGFIRRKAIHGWFSAGLLVFLVVSFGLGISVSGQYNRSKHFTTPHQILALLTIAPLLVVSLLPLPRLSALSPVIPRLHVPLAFLTFILLLISGGLGLRLSSSPTPFILAFSVIALLVVLFLLVLQTLIWKCGRGRRPTTGDRSASRSSRHGKRWLSGSRQSDEEEDTHDLVLAAYYAGQKSGAHDGREGLSTPSSGGSGLGNNGRYSPNGGIYGGGTMPGPQYLLNMHPGVPVHRFD